MASLSFEKCERALSVHQAEIIALKDGLVLASSCGLLLDCVDVNVVFDVNSHSTLFLVFLLKKLLSY